MRRTVALTLSLTSLLGIASVAAAGWEEGVKAFSAKKYAEAAREFEQLAQERPDWPGSYLMLGRCLLKQSRPQEAIAPLRKAYDLNPNDESTKMVLAQAYLEARRYTDGANLLKSIDAGALNGQQKSMHQQMLAVALSKSGQSDDALTALRKAAAGNPQDSDLQYQLGAMELANGETGAAVKSLEQAVKLAPSDPERRRTLVRALIRQGRESRGSSKLNAYKRAVTIAGDLAGKTGTYDDRLLLGEAQLGAKAYADAAQTFQAATKQNASGWIAFYYLGQAQTSINQLSQAEATLRLGLTKTTDAKSQALLWGQLGFVYEKTKNFAQAKAAYSKIGDQASLDRVAENERISAENRLIEEENAEIERLKKEAAELEAQMKDLPPG